jgi:hypothetical protein
MKVKKLDYYNGFNHRDAANGGVLYCNNNPCALRGHSTERDSLARLRYVG